MMTAQVNTSENMVHPEARSSGLNRPISRGPSLLTTGPVDSNSNSTA